MAQVAGGKGPAAIAVVDRPADPQAEERLVGEQGVGARLQAVGGRICADRTDRETAFTLAAAVALADNRLLDEESLLVGSIAEWYGISDRRCAQILQQFESD